MKPCLTQITGIENPVLYHLPENLAPCVRTLPMVRYPPLPEYLFCTEFTTAAASDSCNCTRPERCQPHMIIKINR
jgi:hypothetical protein